MLDVFNDFYERIKNGKPVSFQLTTNHPHTQFISPTGAATYAAGELVATGYGHDSVGWGQLPALIGKPTRWYFLRSDGGHLKDDGSEKDLLQLTLFLRYVQANYVGSLRNLNWSEPIPIQSLELVSYDQGNGICLCQGLDGNRAAIALVLRQRISVK